MELLIASNLLLWIVVIALSVGYFSLLNRARAGRELSARPEELVGGSVPANAVTLLGKVRLGPDFVPVFLTESCEPCSRLASELASTEDPVPIPVVVVGTAPVTGTAVSAQIRDALEVRALQSAFRVTSFPFASVVRNGRVAGAGSVNAVRDLRRLAELSD